MVLPAAALFVTQLIHGAVPADTEGGSVVGLVGGGALLLASLVGLVGALRNRSWAVPLTAWTGAIVAVGFVLYHALPFTSPLTNPYPGEDVGLAAWLSVGACVAAAAWAATRGLRRDRVLSTMT